MLLFSFIISWLVVVFFFFSLFHFRSLWIHLHRLKSLMWHQRCHDARNEPWMTEGALWCLCFIHCLRAISLGKSDTDPRTFPFMMQLLAWTSKMNSILPLRDVMHVSICVSDMNTNGLCAYLHTDTQKQSNLYHVALIQPWCSGVMYFAVPP